MYKTQIKVTPKDLGESIEEMVRRITANNEPIDATAPMIYTEKAEEVMPEYDIRTDRQELALDAIEKVQKSEIMRRQNAEQNNTNETTETEA